MADLLAELQDLSVFEYSSRRRDKEAGVNAFADDTHGEVAIDKWASQLLDTQPFDRLDRLKQLGCAYKVFPGAYHTRRQHSLGVSHLAVEHGLQLYRNGATAIMAEDLMLLGVAGLLHDLGHGPFSHVCESQIFPRLGLTGWTHEEMSGKLIDHIATVSSLDLTPQQWGRVKDMIGGMTTPGNGWVEELACLPSVVSGDADMDRGDYLLRDSRATGVQHEYDTWELIRASKVLPVDGVPTICYAASAQPVLAAQFAARALMHEWVYQLQRVKAVECMLADALCAANHVLRISALASSHTSFMSLDDGLLGDIRRGGLLEDPRYTKAAAILARADTGDYYPVAEELDVTDCDPRRLGSCATTLEQQLAGYCAGLTADDIRVVFAEIGHGRKHQDPLGYMLLYDTQLNTRRAIEGLARPARFSQRLMRVYLAKDCHRNPILINSCIVQVQAAVDRFAAERGLQAASTLQQQQQQQPPPVLLSSRSSALSSSITIPGALSAMPLPREEVRQLASPVPVTPVVETWSRNRQQQQQQRRTRQRLMDGAPHRLVLQLSSDDDEDELQQLQLQQQQQGWEGLLSSADAQLHDDDDADLPPSQLSQLSQVQLPFAYSQEEQ